MTSFATIVPRMSQVGVQTKTFSALFYPPLKMVVPPVIAIVRPNWVHLPVIAPWYFGRRNRRSLAIHARFSSSPNGVIFGVDNACLNRCDVCLPMPRWSNHVNNPPINQLPSSCPLRSARDPTMPNYAPVSLLIHAPTDALFIREVKIDTAERERTWEWRRIERRL